MGLAVLSVPCTLNLHVPAVFSQAGTALGHAPPASQQPWTVPSPAIHGDRSIPSGKKLPSQSFFLVETGTASPGMSVLLPAHRHHSTLYPPVTTGAVGDQAISTPSRLTHDISLEEFEDEDLSEITDECGISLHCKESLASRVSVMGMGRGIGMGRMCQWGWQDHQPSCRTTRSPDE